MIFEEALVAVWRQSLVESSSSVEVERKKFPVRNDGETKAQAD